MSGSGRSPRVVISGLGFVTSIGNDRAAVSLSLRELAMSVFLAQPGTEVMAVAVYIYLEEGAVENAAAISVVIALLSVVTVMAARKIAGKGALEVG